MQEIDSKHERGVKATSSVNEWHQRPPRSFERQRKLLAEPGETKVKDHHDKCIEVTEA